MRTIAFIALCIGTAAGLAGCTDSKAPVSSQRQASTAQNGASVNGASVNGASVNGASVNGPSVNGPSVNGSALGTVMGYATSVSHFKGDRYGDPTTQNLPSPVAAADPLYTP